MSRPLENIADVRKNIGEADMSLRFEIATTNGFVVTDEQVVRQMTNVYKEESNDFVSYWFT